jgi:hypothetical protein
MNKTYHYLSSISDTEKGHGYIAYAWCGANSLVGGGQVHMTRRADETNCEECKEASAMHLLGKVGT